MNKDLNIETLEFNNMQVMKVFMQNGNEYQVIWDIDSKSGNNYKMIDLRKGRVYLNKNFISDRNSMGKVKENLQNIHPKARKDIIDYYGEDILSE